MLIKKLLFIGVPDMEQQYRRPFELSSNADMQDALENALEETGVSTLRPSAMVDVVSRGLRFTADRPEKSDIVGGWGRHRYRFIAELEVDRPSRRGVPGYRVVVVGYTESSDHSLDGDSIPEDMRMYINGVIGIRDMIIMDRGHETIKSDIQQPYQILRGISGRNSSRSDFLARPADVFNTITVRQRYAGEDGKDLRVRFTGPKTSSRYNNTRAGYLSRLIDGDHEGRLEEAVHQNNQFRNTRDTVAADRLRDPKLTSNQFIETLSSFQPDINDDVSFLYEDLVRFSPRDSIESLDDATTILNFADNDFDYDSVSWKGSDGATMAAVTITRELPAFMIDRALSSIVFIVDNEELDSGEAQFDVIDWSSFVEGIANSEDAAEGLVRNFIRNVIDPLTRNNRILFYARIEFTSEGMILSEIEWDGGRSERFNFPAFGDSLVPPTYTSNYDNLRDLTDRYIDLRKKVIDPVIDRENDLDERSWRD